MDRIQRGNLEALLDDPSHRLSTMEYVEIIDECTRRIGKMKDKVSGKKCIFLIGNTGEGKSTLVNQIAGKTFTIEKVDQIKQITCQDPIAKIGQTNTSQTFIPEIYDCGKDLLVCDCPGYRDNRHEAISISNMINLSLIFNQAAEVSIVIVISSHAFASTKAEQFRDLELLLVRMLGGRDRVIDNISSIKMAITKWTPNEIIQDFEEYVNSICRGAKQQDLLYLLKINSGLFTCNPLGKKHPGSISKQEMNEILRNMSSIRSADRLYKIAFNEKEQKFIDEIKKYFKTIIQKQDYKVLSQQFKKLKYFESIDHPKIEQFTKQLDQQLIKNAKTQKELSLKHASIDQIQEIKCKLHNDKFEYLIGLLGQRKYIKKQFGQEFMNQYIQQYNRIRKNKLMDILNRYLLEHKQFKSCQIFQEYIQKVEFIVNRQILNHKFQIMLEEETNIIVNKEFLSLTGKCLYLVSKSDLLENASFSMFQEICKIYAQFKLILKKHNLYQFQEQYQNKRYERMEIYIKQHIGQIDFGELDYSQQINLLVDNMKIYSQLPEQKVKEILLIIKKICLRQVKKIQSFALSYVQQENKITTNSQKYKELFLLSKNIQLIQKVFQYDNFIEEFNKKRFQLLIKYFKTMLIDIKNGKTISVKQISQINSEFKRISQQFPQLEVTIRQELWAIMTKKFDLDHQRIIEKITKQIKGTSNSQLKKVSYLQGEQVKQQFNDLIKLSLLLPQRVKGTNKQYAQKKEKYLKQVLADAKNYLFASLDKCNQSNIGKYHYGQVLQLLCSPTDKDTIESRPWHSNLGRNMIYFAAEQINIKRPFQVNANLIIIAPLIKVHTNHMLINLSGENGKNAQNLSDNGQDGTQSGSFYIGCKAISRSQKLTVKLSGGNGGNGVKAQNCAQINNINCKNKTVSLVMQSVNGGNAGQGGVCGQFLPQIKTNHYIRSQISNGKDGVVGSGSQSNFYLQNNVYCPIENGRDGIVNKSNKLKKNNGLLFRNIIREYKQWIKSIGGNCSWLA